MAEKRVDPATGEAVTLKELMAHYKGTQLGGSWPLGHHTLILIDCWGLKRFISL